MAHRIYLLPNLSTPVDKELYIALDILWAFGVSKWINLDGHVLEAQATNGGAHAGLEKGLPVPSHQGFDCFGQHGVTTEQRVVR